MKPRAMTAYEGVGTRISEAEAISLSIPIEVRNETALREALAAGGDSLLLDNITVEEARRAIRASFVLEISGRMTIENAPPMH
jgi:nicotinate-nucleotide pyrophosphorylase